MAIATLVSNAMDLPAGREVRSAQALEAVQRPLGEALLLAVSHEGGTHATNEAIRAARAAGSTTALITVGPGSPGAALANHVIMTEEQDQSWCHTIGYLAPLVVGAALAAKLRKSKLDAAAIRALLDVSQDAHGPAEIAARLVSAKQNTDQCAGALGQRLFEEYVRRGWIAEQLAESRALYRQKSERLLAALERHMAAGVRWTQPHGGFFSWLTFPGGDSVELARLAAERGVGLVPGTLFYPDGRGAENVRLSFSMVDETLIDEGIERLAALVSR